METHKVPEKKSIRNAVSISVLAQAISSATNFTFGLYLVRKMIPTEFGLYGIGFALSLLFVGIGNSIFLTQMVNNYEDKNPSDRAAYLTRIFVGLTIFSMCASLLICTILLMATAAKILTAKEVFFGVAILVAALGFLLKDFFTRRAYSVRKERESLLINIVVSFALFSITASLEKISLIFESTNSLSIYGLSNLAGAVFGLYRAQFVVADVKFSQIKKDCHEAWFGGGGWYLLVTGANAIQTQAHTIVGTVLLGPLGVATMNAARLLLTPPLVLLPALSQVLLPRMLEKKKLSKSNISTAGMQISMLFIGISLCYIATLIPMIDWVSENIIKNNYYDLKPTTYGWCIAVLFIAASNGLALENHANKEFKSLLFATTLAGAASIISAWVLINFIGSPGGPIGLGVGEIVLALFLIYRRGLK